MGYRYDRNLGTITEEEQVLLKQKSVCIIGCGGLGGGIIEGLTRLGVGKLTIVDADVFDATNLNRQVLSHEGNLGRSKAEEGALQMKQINAEVQIRPLQVRLNGQNAREIIKGHDVVVDALDNVQSRLILEEACEKEGVPLVHGAIGGWSGQVAVVRPGDRLLHAIYCDDLDDGTADGKSDGFGCKEPEPVNQDSKPEGGNPSFTPAVIAGMQVAETLKVLLGRDDMLENELLMVDLLTHQYERIDFKK